MADNYVQIKIKASDTAKPDLTELKAQLDELGAKTETARVDIDDRDGEVKLLRLNSRLAELNRKVANPKISVSGAARAQAEIAAVRLELDRLNEKAATAGRGGLLSRILFGAAGAAEGGGGGGGGGGLAGLLPGGGSLAVLGAAVPVIGALATEAVGLASGFAAAGAGAGSFALLAAPAFKSVTDALAQIKADQTAYNRALTDTAKNNALKHLKMDYAALDPQQRGVVKGIQMLKQEFGNMTDALRPDAFRLFNQGVQLAGKLLPATLPFAETFANVLSKLLGQASKFASSKGFKDWLKQFHSLEGPALNSIGAGIGKVAIAVGKLLTVMSGKDVAHAINIAFGTIAGVINGVTYAVRRLMQNWDGMSSAFRRVRHDIASAGHDIAHVFDTVRHAVASFAHEVAQDFNNVRHFNAVLAHDFAHAFDMIRHGVATLAHNIAVWFDRIRHSIASKFDEAVSYIRGVPHRILAALGNLGSLLFNAGKAIVQGLINGIKSMFGALGSVASSIGHFIAGLKGPLPKDLTLLVPHGQAIMTGLMDGMRSRFPHLRSQLGEVTGMIGGMHVPAAPGRRGAAGAGSLQLQVTAGGGSAFEQFMVQAIRNYVRIRGGSVQGALGH